MSKFLKIFQVLVFLSIVFLLSFNIVLAGHGGPHLSTGADVLNITFNEGCTPVKTEDGVQLCEINWIGTYIAGIYRYGISLAAVLAVVMVMVGGFVWLSSGGSPDKIKTAKSIIGSAFAGLLLALFAFVILNTINPRLVNLDPLKIEVIKNVASEYRGEGDVQGCCTYRKRVGYIWWIPNTIDPASCDEISSTEPETAKQVCLSRGGSQMDWHAGIYCSVLAGCEQTVLGSCSCVPEGGGNLLCFNVFNPDDTDCEYYTDQNMISLCAFRSQPCN